MPEFRKIQLIGEDAGGTKVAVRTDSSGRIAQSGTASVMLGDIDEINSIKSGTITQVQTPRKLQSGTIESGLGVSGTATTSSAGVGDFDKFTVGINTDGTVDVTHQLQMNPGGQWFDDGSDTGVKGDLTVSIGHKAKGYRAEIVNKDASGTVSVDVEFAGN